MTEQNIRDAFESTAHYAFLSMSKNSDGGYIDGVTRCTYGHFKAGYIAAFKMILESENE